MSELGAPWMCIGGVAVIALGVPRFTADERPAELLEDPSRLETFERLLRTTGLGT